jgi:uracil-DNA glycosylase
MSQIESLQKEMRGCRRCLQAGFQIVPGAVFSGVSSAQVMIIGQAPGITEAQVKRPFNAGSGRRLFEWLGEAGWGEKEFRSAQYMTAVTKCFPGKNESGRGDRVPTKIEQDLCRPFLQRELSSVKPRLIVPVGRLAINLFYPSKARLTETIGTSLFLEQTQPWNNPLRPSISPDTVQEPTSYLPRDGSWIVPLPHPSGASSWPNKPDNKQLIDRAIAILGAIRDYWNL